MTAVIFIFASLAGNLDAKRANMPVFYAENPPQTPHDRRGRWAVAVVAAHHGYPTIDVVEVGFIIWKTPTHHCWRGWSGQETGSVRHWLHSTVFG